MSRIRSASFDELDAPTLYTLLQLRVDVFVVEQRCPYPELDGRDRESGAEHWWVVNDAEEPISYLRVLHEADGTRRIGRVVTAPGARSQGVAARLLRHVLERMTGPVVVSAQAHLADWYATFGFVTTSEPYDEDGIPHLAMRWTPGSARA